MGLWAGIDVSGASGAGCVATERVWHEGLIVIAHHQLLWTIVSPLTVTLWLLFSVFASLWKKEWGEGGGGFWNRILWEPCPWMLYSCHSLGFAVSDHLIVRSTPVTHCKECCTPVTHCKENCTPVTHCKECSQPGTHCKECCTPGTHCKENCTPVTHCKNCTPVTPLGPCCVLSFDCKEYCHSCYSLGFAVSNQLIVRSTVHLSRFVRSTPVAHCQE